MSNRDDHELSPDVAPRTGLNLDRKARFATIFQTLLSFGRIAHNKAVRVTIELPDVIHRDLRAYAKVLAAEIGQTTEPMKFIAPMLARLMATNRAFAQARRASLFRR